MSGRGRFAGGEDPLYRNGYRKGSPIRDDAQLLIDGHGSWDARRVQLRRPEGEGVVQNNITDNRRPTDRPSSAARSNGVGTSRCRRNRL